MPKKEITDYVAEQMPDLNMQWAHKEHDNTLQIPEDFDEGDILTRPYEIVKKEFEEKHAKIINKSAFVLEDNKEVLI